MGLDDRGGMATAFEGASNSLTSVKSVPMVEAMVQGLGFVVGRPPPLCLKGTHTGYRDWLPVFAQLMDSSTGPEETAYMIAGL